MAQVKNDDWRRLIDDADSKTQLMKIALAFMQDREPQLWGQIIVKREQLDNKSIVPYPPFSHC